ncbi:tRNA uridine-5-carboxymethylaminomethyl(34) synthesis GTPase MnmE [Kangiella koreensis]|uniref:tRNA modification GTPase MnmE n=1 Tax=Kangiella koreensis (strain DSM 16069 / JCM 12317 / KCTC 12182 / SW-125) TaxID=523791 RepID=C7RAF7_KANKD|nr:tRNA uridine-5-carboxymethylaminomethyl(34) synthesis GTPase MnmE [Kangiella koreensis]ACV28051.1 tRNA modification GTPase TrmE [Kangiella koreensis DSM 16069]
MTSQDTIAAIATPPGRGGVGIIRVSGKDATKISQVILGKSIKVREATYLPFLDHLGHTIDQGIAILFKAPNSFTGEDVLELQGHGGPVILDMLLKEVVSAGARIARPGEFSERAFLNDKLDLAQAEAIADLIESTSEQAARSAMRSLQGEFSNKVNQLVESLIHLRIYVEAAIDFPEEEIDFLSDGKVQTDLYAIIDAIKQLKKEAQQGSILREGMTVVIAGKPNAGKSSLLNTLAGKESAIVTEIAGTTRDVLREHIHIDGLPVHIIDTAGLRESDDTVEKIGIERAWQEIDKADQIVLVADASETHQFVPHEIDPAFTKFEQFKDKLLIVANKVDLTDQLELPDATEYKVLPLSAKTGQGIEELKNTLKDIVGFKQTSEGSFIARRRHLDAIERALLYCENGRQQLEVYHAGELLADELRQAQNALSEITGEFTADDLLGRIFSSFCIGK